MLAEKERIPVGTNVKIYQRGKKKIWIADFCRNGEHTRESLGTADKKVAIRRATKLSADLNAGTHQAAPPQITVEQASQNYISVLETEGRARKTIVKYRGIFELFVEFLAERGITRLHQVTPACFDEFRAMRKAKRHAKTVYTESVVIKQLTKWAKTRRLLVEDPLAGLRLEKPKMVSKPGPTLAQVNAILDAAPAPLRSQVAVLAFTGMRAAELQRFRREHLDLIGNWIHIVSLPGAETKTGHSRKVPIHGRLRAVLEALASKPGPYLFSGDVSKKFPEGRPLNTKRMNDLFRRVVEALGMPSGRKDGFVIHSLRHFFETFTVNSNIPQRAIDTWLGHRADQSMAAVYYRLTDEDSQMFMLRVPFATDREGPDAAVAPDQRP